MQFHVALAVACGLALTGYSRLCKLKAHNEIHYLVPWNSITVNAQNFRSHNIPWVKSLLKPGMEWNGRGGTLRNFPVINKKGFDLGLGIPKSKFLGFRDRDTHIYA